MMIIMCGSGILGEALTDDLDNPLLYRASGDSHGPAFPAGLPNLRYQGHGTDTMTIEALSHSPRMQAAAAKLGYVSA